MLEGGQDCLEWAGWERGQTHLKTMVNWKRLIHSHCLCTYATWVVVPESYLYVRGWVSDVQGVAQAATQTHFLGSEPAVRASVTLYTALQWTKDYRQDLDCKRLTSKIRIRLISDHLCPRTGSFPQLNTSSLICNARCWSLRVSITTELWVWVCVCLFRLNV